MIRVAITGPESTGKSTLARKLADHFNTVCVGEYSREYLAAKSGQYVFEDIVEIAKGQYRKELELEKEAKKLLFLDTDQIVNKVWSEFMFGKCDKWITNQIISHKYDLYLLTDIDIPWEEDPLREHPDKREDLMMIYKNELNHYKLPYIIINGTRAERFGTATNAIKKIINNKESR